MTVLSHALIGAGLSVGRDSLPGSFLVGFISHFLFDIVPHNDYIYLFYKFDKKKKAYESPISLVLLALTAVTIGTLFLLSWNPGIIIGALGGVLPDIISSLSNRWANKLTLFDHFHNLLQRKCSLAEILVRDLQHLKIKRGETTEEALDNYKTISHTFWGKIGWGTEILIELAVAFYFLRLLYFSLPIRNF